MRALGVVMAAPRLDDDFRPGAADDLTVEPLVAERRV